MLAALKSRSRRRLHSDSRARLKRMGVRRPVQFLRSVERQHGRRNVWMGLYLAETFPEMTGRVSHWCPLQIL